MQHYLNSNFTTTNIGCPLEQTAWGSHLMRSNPARGRTRLRKGTAMLWRTAPDRRVGGPNCRKCAWTGWKWDVALLPWRTRARPNHRCRSSARSAHNKQSADTAAPRIVESEWAHRRPNSAVVESSSEAEKERKLLKNMQLWVGQEDSACTVEILQLGLLLF